MLKLGLGIEHACNLLLAGICLIGMFRRRILHALLANDLHGTVGMLKDPRHF